jgi:protein-tyrosine kinase
VDIVYHSWNNICDRADLSVAVREDNLIMSKIEKALNKARTNTGLQVVSSRPRHSEQPSVDNLPADGGTRALIGQRANANESIAQMREKSLLDRQMLAQNQIISPESGENGTVRAFREIRTKIIQKSRGENCIILLTSVTGGGGSSFVALNLGAAFAFDAGKTALVIDCNLKNPSLYRLFGRGTFPGLTDYLENTDMNVSEIIHPVGIERLRIIPSGGRRELPAEYFTSLKMRRLLDSVRQRYRERYIIMDAPPMTESADMQILSELCDYVVMVVPYGRVTESQVDACVKVIGDNKFLGLVFNNEPALPAFRWRNFLNPFAALVHMFIRPPKEKLVAVK